MIQYNVIWSNINSTTTNQSKKKKKTSLCKEKKKEWSMIQFRKDRTNERPSKALRSCSASSEGAGTLAGTLRVAIVTLCFVCGE